MNPIDAARAVVHEYPGGATSLAPRIGKAPSTLRNELAWPPLASIKAKLGLMDAVAITNTAQDGRIVHAFNESCGFCPPLRLPEGQEELAEGTFKDLLERGAKLSAAIADEFEEFQRDIADGVITPNELARCDGKILTVMSALVCLSHSLRARMETDQRAQIEKVTPIAPRGAA